MTKRRRTHGAAGQTGKEHASAGTRPRGAAATTTSSRAGWAATSSIDWTDGEDRLDVDDFDLTLGQALARGSQVGNHVQFDLDSTLLVVQNADLAAFGATDFILD